MDGRAAAGPSEHPQRPTCTDAATIELRRLHEEMDDAVLAEYGWVGAAPPVREGASSFEDGIIDRLFGLNAERAEQERDMGLRACSKKGGGRRAGALVIGRRGLLG